MQYMTLLALLFWMCVHAVIRPLETTPYSPIDSPACQADSQHHCLQGFLTQSFCLVVFSQWLSISLRTLDYLKHIKECKSKFTSITGVIGYVFVLSLPKNKAAITILKLLQVVSILFLRGDTVANRNKWQVRTNFKMVIAALFSWQW